jgi:UDP-glucose 4-epimerase
VYDATLIERDLGFRCKTDFATVLDALRNDRVSPVAHDANYVSPKEQAARR